MKRPLCYIAVALLIAIYVYYLFVPAFQDFDIEEGGWETFQGTVYSKEYRNNNLIIYLRDISSQNFKKTKPEGIMCYVSVGKEPKLYSKVEVSGKISKFSTPDNPGEFNTRNYYKILKLDFALKEVTIQKETKKYSYYKELLYRIKRKVEAIYDYELNENDSALIKALVLGNKKEMSSNQKHLYQMNGISHIMAISGLHISLLGLGMYKILKRRNLSRIFTTAIPIAIIVIYGDIVGGSSSATRAIMMFTLKLLADYYGKRFDNYTALAFAMITVLLEQPLYIFHAGFLLSFSALLGILIFPKFIKDLFPKSNFVINSFICNLSIVLIQMPIILNYFYEYPLISFLMNLVIVPMIPAVIMLGVLLIPGFYFEAILGFLPEITHLVIFALEKICDSTVNIPGFMWVCGKPTKAGIYLYYTGIILFYFLLKYQKNKAVFVPLWLKVIVIIVSINFLIFKPNYGMKITYLSVGQGNCACITDTRGHSYLIDGGSVTKNKLCEYTLMPFLRYSGISTIQGIFITHLDEDHVSGIMDLLNNSTKEFRVKNIYLAKSVIKDDKYYKLESICKRKKIKINYLQTGDTIIDKKVKMNIYYPRGNLITEDRNEYSLVIGLKYGDFSALFPGDVSEKGEIEATQFLPESYECDVFLATHHGSRYSNSTELLEQINPMYTVISCGAGNSYGHPHKEAVERLEEVCSKILKTMDNGAVIINTDGQKFNVSCFH